MKKRILIALIMLAVVLSLCSCTKKEKKDFYDYVNSKCDPVLGYKINDDICYNINGISQTAYKDYYDGIIQGINRFNEQIQEVCPYDITYQKQKSLISAYKFKLSTLKGGDAFADNSATSIGIPNGILTSSTITHYVEFQEKEKLTVQDIKTITIHELGHTLGLADLENADIRTMLERYSVMYFTYMPYYTLKPTELTELDLQIIKDLYK